METALELGNGYRLEEFCGAITEKANTGMKGLLKVIMVRLIKKRAVERASIFLENK